MKHKQTPGGNRLRSLREFRGQTQLDVEFDASLGIGYLQRLESGKVQQPERDTLVRILSALEAKYTERREVLELFGYVVDAPIPNDKEVQWAISVCETEISQAVFPAYLLDCSHRVLYWNKFVPFLFANTSNATFEKQIQYISALKLVFDTSNSFALQIINHEEFFRAQIRALRYEMQKFHDEEWYASLIEDMLHIPHFNKYWSVEKNEAIHLAARPLTTMQVKIANGEQLEFRLLAEPYVQDNRFRVIFYLPANQQTIQRCLEWL